MFNTPFFGRDLPTLTGKAVFLRMPLWQDYAEWAQLRGESRTFLEPWEPQWAPDELSRRAFRQRLKRYREEFDRGTGISFFLFEKSGGRLAGGLSVSNIRHGVAQSGHLGYWMGERFAGHGLMLDALERVIPFTFETLRLHRLEAACIPDNKRSIRLLEKAGFQREGLLRSYLRINGSWQDHYLYALVAGDDRAKYKRG
ncbi:MULTISPECIES: GNAT family N-acetyltransferase [Phyllobacteriaceae]|uniref:GNAT family N-acetyltransferase n=1 Tax=Phyllobacteriaceae TaxID=69277 RepID=UPI002AC9F442|nr:GNAT family protein [Chelativorans sp. M5D2P16]MDZ5698820.1 GNAT family protein [Chelativorans sp. M5D2P16]